MFAEYLDGFRDLAEQRMDESSRATVRRKTGQTTKDNRGLTVPAWVAIYTDHPCRIAGMARSQSPSKTINIGGIEVQVATRTAHFPHSTTDLADGDLIEITEGELAGSVWQIVESDPADQQNARRVPIISTQRPKEWS
jgi:hypothetical protein